MNHTTKKLTTGAFIASLYVVLSLAFPMMSFGMIQFRLGEILMFLPFYHKKFTPALTLGCFIVNIFSTVSALDVIFGTLGTFLACWWISKLTRALCIPFVAALVNGIIIGLMLYFVLDAPLILSIFYVGISELVAVFLGVLLAAGFKNQIWFQTYILEEGSLK